jgi:hypothetical protein
MLVDRPADENMTTGFASWYAQLWLDEPLTLRAFRTLLGSHRHRDRLLVELRDQFVTGVTRWGHWERIERIAPVPSVQSAHEIC